MARQRIAIDFDGCLHKYLRGWQDGSIYDEPVDGALEAIVKLSSKFDVYIFTTRAREDLNQGEAIRKWLLRQVLYKGLDDAAFQLFERIVITDRKMPAIAYIDDRGIRFTNWSDIKKYFL